MDFDNILRNSDSFFTVPAWMDRAIQTKAKNMTVYLANSRAYNLNELDKVLGTAPLMQKINMEVN